MLGILLVSMFDKKNTFSGKHNVHFYILHKMNDFGHSLSLSERKSDLCESEIASRF